MNQVSIQRNGNLEDRQKLNAVGSYLRRRQAFFINMARAALLLFFYARMDFTFSR